MDLNRIQIMGRSGSKPELKYTQSGTAVLNLSIATSKNTAKQGDPATWVSTWHKVIVWGKKAEQLAPMIDKGTPVFVEGELQSREYSKADGTKQTSVEINARWAEVVQKPQLAADSPFSSVSKNGSTPDYGSNLNESDIPF